MAKLESGYRAVPIVGPKDGGDEILLTEAEAAEISRELGSGMRGPVLIKWCEQLLADRAGRMALECGEPPAHRS